MGYNYILILLCSALFSFGFRQENKAPAQTLPAIDYIAYQPGEKLRYDLTYNGISAGEGNFEIKPQPKLIAGKPHYHISIVGKSYPVFDPFYRVRDYYESYIDQETLMPSVFIRNVSEGKFKDQEYYIFDRSKNQIIANKQVYADKKDLHDIISAFYYLRCIDFSNKKTGYTINVESFFDEEVFPMGVQYMGKKVISTTQFGKVRCHVFRPKLIEGRVFQDQQDMTLYVSDDKNQIPVRIESKIYMGIVRAELVKYSGLKFPFGALAASGE